MRVVILGQAIIHENVAWSDSLRELTAGADAVICNFEGCLPPPGAWPMKSKTVHPVHAEALDMLRALGVTHIGLANNHTWDFGHAGIVSTRARTREAGFAVAGAGRDGDEAWTPGIGKGVALIALDAGPTPAWAIAGPWPGVASIDLRSSIGLPREDIERLNAISEATGDAERRRRRQAIGFDAPDPDPRPFGLHLEEAKVPCEVICPSEQAMDRACRSLEAARQAADLVVVAIHYHHWSPDWLSPPGWFGGIAERLSQAGADAVVGTGPPWPFDPMRTGARLIAPGLGNLVFHTRRAEAYDRNGLPVWQGRAGVYDGNGWHMRGVSVERPFR